MADGPTAPDGARDDADEPGRRGSLAIAERAVERIACAAAAEVAGVRRTTRAGTRPGVVSVVADAVASTLGTAYPRADADVAGSRCRLGLQLDVEWPRSAARVGAAVREHVAMRVADLTDLRVDAVDVAVVRVSRPAAIPPRAVR